MGNASELTGRLRRLSPRTGLTQQATQPGPRQTDPRDGSIRIVEGFGRPGERPAPVDRSPMQMTD